ncbi:MAG: CRISPR-associated protein (TIGR03986 family) [Oleiphilaceae bacterium]|jgi:CRISPR-associated protein (TIGR03986 family)
MSQDIHAPYHFVPLSKWVYMPDWAHLVSHDHPFKDGVSGSIDYTLTNATPLLVGGEQENNLVKWARTPDGTPVIPGSSLKGMIRSVMEIATFGKFANIDDAQFAYRDMEPKSKYLSVLSPRSQKLKQEACWLKFDSKEKKWLLTPTKKINNAGYFKVKNEDINAILKGTNINNELDAIARYRQHGLDEKAMVFKYKDLSDSNFNGYVHWALLGNGEHQGHLVFTHTVVTGKGNIKNWNFSYMFTPPSGESESGKHLEEIVNKFRHDYTQNSKKVVLSNNGEKISLLDYLMKHPHSQHGIPVFAIREQNTLQAISLTKMPRLPYKNSITQLADQQQSLPKMDQNSSRDNPLVFDMAELMFGTLRQNGASLKSRVSFSDANCTNFSADSFMTSGEVVLNSPKASFFPSYLEAGKDYNDETAKLSGWKRYFAQTSFTENPPDETSDPDKDRSNVSTKLELMKKNHSFSGKIVFHNLNRHELNALLWVLKLGQSEDTHHYHSLGHGKSLGAGAIKFSDLELKHIQLNSDKSAEPKLKIQQCLADFEDHINHELSTKKENAWRESTQIKHLLAIACTESDPSRKLSYMELKAHSDTKNAGKVLPLIKDNGTTLTRQESLNDVDFPYALGRGRLSSMLNELADNKKEELNVLIDAAASDREKRLKDIENQKEAQQAEIEKAKKMAKMQAEIEALPEDEKEVATLLQELIAAPSDQERQNLNPEVEALLKKFIESQVSQKAAQALYDLLKHLACHYMRISNKKKLAPRKEIRQALKEKYNIQDDK